MVIDGITNEIIARQMSLDIVFCLIEGYKNRFYNEKMILTIEEDKSISAELVEINITGESR